MDSFGVIGIIDDSSNGNMQWKIPENFMMGEMLHRFYCESPPMFFLSNWWCLRFYPNGAVLNDKYKYLTVHLVHISPQDECCIDFCLHLSLDNISRIERQMKADTFTFSESDRIFKWRKILKSDSVWHEEPGLSAITISCFATEGYLPYFAFYRSMSTETKLTKDFEKMYVDGEDTDITITVEGKKFKAHKLILGTRSSKFNKMFEDDKNMSRIKIPNCDAEAFEIFLNFLYTGTVEKLPFVKAKRLHKVAHNFCEDLANMLERYLEYDTSTF